MFRIHPSVVLAAELHRQDPQKTQLSRVPYRKYAANNVTTVIDGRTINLEALLIRYFLRVGFGGSVTNSQLSGRFHNITAFRMDVMVEWAKGANTPIAAGHTEIQLAANTKF